MTSYEELDVCASALGRLILRRRQPPGFEEEIYEIMLGDDLLMSSYLNESEMQLAHLTIEAAGTGSMHVLVGGLGLGHTAEAALSFERVRSLAVLELLPEVIGWHDTGRVPLGPVLAGDPRCTFRQGDFFEEVGDAAKHGAWHPAGGYGAILVDIDHAPDSWLAKGHQRFYDEGGLASAARLLAPDGAFGFWSAGDPNADFLTKLEAVFGEVETHAVEVYNPMIDEEQTDTIYVAKGVKIA